MFLLLRQNKIHIVVVGTKNSQVVVVWTKQKPSWCQKKTKGMMGEGQLKNPTSVYLVLYQTKPVEVWPRLFDWLKKSTKFKASMPWVRCAFGNVFLECVGLVKTRLNFTITQLSTFSCSRRALLFLVRHNWTVLTFAKLTKRLITHTQMWWL